MQALLFEVQPLEGHEEHYFQRAAALKPLLEKHEGMLFLDRFKSQSRPNVILSHQRWRDEAAIARWRADATHYKAQVAGRHKHFADYRLRISHVTGRFERGQGTHMFTHAGAYLEPGSRSPRYHAIIASTGTPFADEGETFLSVNFEQSYLELIDCANETEASDCLKRAQAGDHVTSAMICIISRDYSMFDRKEAPQYFPDLK